MKRLRLNQLPDNREGHFLKGVVDGEYLSKGTMSPKPPGFRTHSEGVHVHDSEEIFIILQGKGHMELNGELHPCTVGDVLIVEPGEDHHLISSEEDPLLINLWLHVGSEPHPEHLKKR